MARSHDEIAAVRRPTVQACRAVATVLLHDPEARPDVRERARAVAIAEVLLVGTRDEESVAEAGLEHGLGVARTARRDANADLVRSIVHAGAGQHDAFSSQGRVACSYPVVDVQQIRQGALDPAHQDCSPVAETVGGDPPAVQPCRAGRLEDDAAVVGEVGAAY
jgi:hypothetical protein